MHNASVKGLVKHSVLKIDMDSRCIQGFMKGGIVWNNNRPTTKSFFPDTWSERMIIEKTVESLKSIKGDLQLRDNGFYTMNGITKCGKELRIVFTRAGKIHSAYPVGS